jgi:hypothetical protein
MAASRESGPAVVQRRSVLIIDGERLPEQRLGLGETDGVAIQDGEVVQRFYL